MGVRIFIDQHLPDSGKLDIYQASQVHHIHRVLRVKKNTVIQIFGLCRREFSAIVESSSSQAVVLRILEQIPSSTESPIHIALGQSVSRGKRMDYTVQKATELGVCSIYPLYSQYSHQSMNDSQAEKKCEHWKTIIRHATEQSKRLVIPEIYLPQKLESWLAQASQTERILLHEKCYNSFDFSKANIPDSLALLVGPEGGFSESEVAMARDYGFIPIQLGPRVLRTETAAPTILTLVQWFWGDLHG